MDLNLIEPNIDIITLTNSSYDIIYEFVKQTKLKEVFVKGSNLENKHKYIYILCTKYIILNPKINEQILFEFGKDKMKKDRWKYDEEYNPYMKWHPFLLDWHQLTEKDQIIGRIYKSAILALKMLFEEGLYDEEFREL